MYSYFIAFMTNSLHPHKCIIKTTIPAFHLERHRPTSRSLAVVTDKFNVIETRWELPALVPLCCSIDFGNSWCMSVKSLHTGKKYLSIFFCILAINQIDQNSKNIALEIPQMGFFVMKSKGNQYLVFEHTY